MPLFESPRWWYLLAQEDNDLGNHMCIIPFRVHLEGRRNEYFSY